MQNFDHLLSPRSAKVKQDAGFWRRALAFIIDVLILDMIISVPFTPMFASMLSRMEHTQWTQIAYTNQEIAAIVLLFLIVYCYFVLFEYLLGQTIGMMFVDIRIDCTVRLSQALLRNCFILPVFPFIVFWLIEPIAILTWRRGVLERLSQTRTVHQRNVLI